MYNNEVRPKIILSKCIEHGHCRYDGSQTSSPFVKKLETYLDIITVCPEVEIGLPVPREAIRIIKVGDEYRLVSSMTGNDVSEKMKAYIKSFKKKYENEQIHGFILRSRSPSCGIKDVKVYKTVGKVPAMGDKVSGFFGKGIIENFDGLAIEDEGRLTNYNIREHFLTQIYTLARYDQVVSEQSMKKLIEFHSQNKYLLMAYHQKLQKDMGKIVANHERKEIALVIEDYSVNLKKALMRPLRRGTNINMLMHLLGYFKKQLTKDEKAYFLDMLEQYSLKKIPMSVLTALIYVWVVRFEESYLLTQTIFNPYPNDILEVTDSGKGIE